MKMPRASSTADLHVIRASNRKLNKRVESKALSGGYAFLQQVLLNYTDGIAIFVKQFIIKSKFYRIGKHKRCDLAVTLINWFTTAGERLRVTFHANTKGAQPDGCRAANSRQTVGLLCPHGGRRRHGWNAGFIFSTPFSFCRLSCSRSLRPDDTALGSVRCPPWASASGCSWSQARLL